jgi:DNA-binding transcriptional MocR family regulator
MTLQQKVRPEALLKHAREANLELSDGRGFFSSGGNDFVRLPFCSLTPDEIQIGVARLNQVIRDLL